MHGSRPGRAPGPAPRPARPPFDDLERTPGNHFDLYVYAAVVRLLENLPDLADVAELAFLRTYLANLPAWARSGDGGGSPFARWCTAIEAWEAAATGHLPVRALRVEAGLDHLAVTLLFTAALAEEDGRFATMFRLLQGDAGPRPTVLLLAGMTADPEVRQAARAAVGLLMRTGLLEPVAETGPRAEWPLQPVPPVWDVIRGDRRTDIVPWAAYRGASEALRPADLIVAPDVAASIISLPELLVSGGARAVIVRGPGGAGRRTVLACVARSLGLGQLEVAGAALDEPKARQLGLLATVLGAMPVIRVEPGLGEVLEVPSLGAYGGPVGITLPRHGGVRGPDLERSVTLTLGMPDAAERRQHWVASLGLDGVEDLAAIADRHRMSGGSIRRAAPIARATAHLDGRRRVAGRDVLEAGRTLRSRSLEVLATRVPVAGTWDDLVVSAAARDELLHVEARCRSRERLVAVLPTVIGVRSAGVRALFSGPSGTGKTLAARVLASCLGMDLYAVELSTVVDKFLGETEKNLTAVFARAAELDAVLLIDEGDALLTGRTDVRTSNDRYANLQTNHLLQLIEAHDGIVLVTTNAGDRIDGAFQRRMDATVDFRMPEPEERWRLWRLHLGVDHAVDEAVLADIAARCSLSGAQIRNAVLHAWLLAQVRDPASPRVTEREVDEAVRREYRKTGATCPLPPASHPARSRS